MMSQSELNVDPNFSILQRRRLIRPASPSPPRKCIPRCLFGPPDPNMDTSAMIARILEDKMGGFCARWNIDPKTGTPPEPKAATTTIPIVIPEVGAKKLFVWTRVSPLENAAQVTSTATAPPAPVGEVVGTQEKSAVANQQIQMTGGVTRGKSPGGPGVKRFCTGGSSSGGAKQRVITDYMKAKKPLPELMDQDKGEKVTLPEMMMDQGTDDAAIVILP